MAKTYQGVGATIDEALRRAVDEIPPHQGTDLATGNVIRWGMQRGGITDLHTVFVVVEYDPDAPPISSGALAE